jgi:hypothetical protein
VVVTRSGDLADLDRLWSDPDAPIVVAAGQGLDPARRDELEERGAQVELTGGQDGPDTIARLERFCPIQFNTEPPSCGTAQAVADFLNALAGAIGSGHRLQAIQANPQASNNVDAAVARPLDQRDILDEILEIGVVSGTLPASLGMQVRKSGRTTGLTSGEITVLDATISVSYATGREATFENQIVTGPISQGGDSGSLVVAASELKAVGLLFAGSQQSTIINPIQDVLDCLDVSL